LVDSIYGFALLGKIFLNTLDIRYIARVLQHSPRFRGDRCAMSLERVVKKPFAPFSSPPLSMLLRLELLNRFHRRSTPLSDMRLEAAVTITIRWNSRFNLEICFLATNLDSKASFQEDVPAQPVDATPSRHLI